MLDLATDLIRLSGLEVGTDIEIRFTGMRPGEKLYEELFFGSESAIPTDHPKVLRAKNGALPIGLSTVIDVLVEGARPGAPTTKSGSCCCVSSRSSPRRTPPRPRMDRRSGVELVGAVRPPG